MAKFHCAEGQCNATTRRPTKDGWQGGLFKLSEQDPQSRNTPAIAYLLFCPRCADLSEKYSTYHGPQC